MGLCGGVPLLPSSAASGFPSVAQGVQLATAAWEPEGSTTGQSDWVTVDSLFLQNNIVLYLESIRNGSLREWVYFSIEMVGFCCGGLVK